MTDAPRYRLVGYDIGTAPDENGGWVHWTDHKAIVARLTAERDRFEAALGRACLVGGTTYLLERAEKAEAERDAALAGAVKVKPLVWFEVEKSRYGGKYTADGYTIRYIGLWLLDFAGQSKAIWRFPTIEAAKAAAQADYEARILAAIQPDPDARQADLAKAVITALHDIDDLVANSEGVSGLHLNGDMAPWSEIMDGGAYGVWLQSVERLREAIRALPPPADLAARIGGE